MPPLLQFPHAKNKRVGVFEVWGDGLGGKAADGVREVRGIVLCAV
jgi:hypothetical protein